MTVESASVHLMQRKQTLVEHGEQGRSTRTRDSLGDAEVAGRSVETVRAQGAARAGVVFRARRGARVDAD